MTSLINRVRFTVAFFVIRVFYTLGYRFNPTFVLGCTMHMDENDPRWDKIFCPDCEGFSLAFIATGVCSCHEESDADWTWYDDDDDFPCCYLCHDSELLGNCPHCKSGIYALDDGDDLSLAAETIIAPWVLPPAPVENRLTVPA